MFYLFTGITLGLSAGISPGPLMALVLSETVGYGKKAGILVALSPLITDVPIVILSLLLVNHFVESDIAYGILSIAGGLYLIWLSRENFTVRDFKLVPTNTHQSLKKGMIANFLNPAPYIFWITIGAPTVIRGWDQHLIFPVLFIVGFYCFLIGSKIFIAILTGIYRTRINNRIYRLMNFFLGMLLVVLSVKFMYEGISYLTGSDN